MVIKCKASFFLNYQNFYFLIAFELTRAILMGAKSFDWTALVSIGPLTVHNPNKKISSKWNFLKLFSRQNQRQKRKSTSRQPNGSRRWKYQENPPSYQLWSRMWSSRLLWERSNTMHRLQALSTWQHLREPLSSQKFSKSRRGLLALSRILRNMRRCRAGFMPYMRPSSS